MIILLRSVLRLPTTFKITFARIIRCNSFRSMCNVMVDWLLKSVDVAVSHTVVHSWRFHSCPWSNRRWCHRYILAVCGSCTTWDMLLNLSRRWVLCIYGCDTVIMIITIKKGLNAVSSKKHRVLAHLILTVVLPVTICIFSIKVIFIWWHKWRSKSSIEQIIPIVVLEPYMILYLLRTIKSKSVDWFTLDKFIYKVSGL